MMLTKEELRLDDVVYGFGRDLKVRRLTVSSILVPAGRDDQGSEIALHYGQMARTEMECNSLLLAHAKRDMDWHRKGFQLAQAAVRRLERDAADDPPIEVVAPVWSGLD